MLRMQAFGMCNKPYPPTTNDLSIVKCLTLKLQAFDLFNKIESSLTNQNYTSSVEGTLIIISCAWNALLKTYGPQVK